MPSSKVPPSVRLPSERGWEDSVASAQTEGLPLGRLLVQAGAISPEQKEAALLAQRNSFLPLGRILRDEHGLTEEQLGAALRQQDFIPRVFLRFFPVRIQTAALLDAAFCRQHEALAFEKLGRLVCVAFSKPAPKPLVKQVTALLNQTVAPATAKSDEPGAETGLEVKPYLAPWEDIRQKVEGLAEKGAAAPQP